MTTIEFLSHLKEAQPEKWAKLRGYHKKLLKEKGFIIHRGTVGGENFVVIATMSTTNRKTGNMIQVWILLENIRPTEAVNSGLDASTVCKGCKFASKNGCYVQVGQAPFQIWKSFKSGLYRELTPANYQYAFGGRSVRFGAYGNPSLLPISKIKAIAKISDGWTGYFHDWKDMHPSTRKAYGQYLMVSTETNDSRKLAEKLKLRYFHVSPIKPKETIECLSETKGLTCEKCKLCSGLTKKNKPSIWINPHGATKTRAEIVALN